MHLSTSIQADLFTDKMQQVQSKERVTEHGEVFTDHREVNAMLDLVKQETENIESRFLEPACGTGNFLVEILRRKLSIVERRYSKNQIEYERYSIAALCSIYGIELLPDNVERCKERLFKQFTHKHARLYKNVKSDFLKSAEFILDKNILQGDALSMKTPDENGKPIVFSEWAFVNPRHLKRKVYVFKEIIPKDSHDLFQAHEISDEGKLVFIPEWIKEFPYFLPRTLFTRWKY